MAATVDYSWPGQHQDPPRISDRVGRVKPEMRQAETTTGLGPMGSVTCSGRTNGGQTAVGFIAHLAEICGCAADGCHVRDAFPLTFMWRAALARSRHEALVNRLAPEFAPPESVDSIRDRNIDRVAPHVVERTVEPTTPATTGPVARPPAAPGCRWIASIALRHWSCRAQSQCLHSGRGRGTPLTTVGSPLTLISQSPWSAQLVSAVRGGQEPDQGPPARYWRVQ